MILLFGLGYIGFWLSLTPLIIIIIEGYYLEDCEDWDLDDIMDVDDENDNQDDDTFLGTGTGSTIAELASQARRDKVTWECVQPGWSGGFA